MRFAAINAAWRGPLDRTTSGTGPRNARLAHGTPAVPCTRVPQSPTPLMREQLLDTGLLGVKSASSTYARAARCSGSDTGQSWVLQQIKARTERPPIPG
jgi:hypothetical protein